MNPLPPNLTGMTARRSSVLPKDRVTLPIRSRRTAIAAPERIDPAAFDFGFSDGLAGGEFEPRNLEPVAYSLGFIDGRNQRRSKGD